MDIAVSVTARTIAERRQREEAVERGDLSRPEMKSFRVDADSSAGPSTRRGFVLFCSNANDYVYFFCLTSFVATS